MSPTIFLVSGLLGIAAAAITQQTYNGSVYVADKAQASFQETFNWCASMGGQLPSIHSRSDIDFIIDKLQMGTTWLGAMEIRDTFYWTDGSAWNPVPDSMARSACATCCGMVLSITKRIIAKSRCDYYSNLFSKVCRLPKSYSELQHVKDQVNEQDIKLTQRLSVDEILYHELVNASFSHADQLVQLEKLITSIVTDLSELTKEVELIEGQRNETNGTIMEHVLSLNETMHARLQQLHNSLNSSSEMVNFSLNQQHDMYTSILGQMEDQMRRQAAMTQQQRDQQISDLQRNFRLVVVILVAAIIIFLSIPVALYFKMRRKEELNDDEVRLSQINDSY